MALIIPNVFADAVNAELGKRIVISKLATDYSDEIDITTCGDVVHFPTFDRITDAQVIEDGGTVDFEEINKMTDNTAEVKQHAKGVTIRDKSTVQVKGAMKAELVEQLSDVMALSLDKTLSDDIIANAAYKTELNGIAEFTPNAMNKALEVFGDQQQISSFAGIVLNSELYSSIVGWDEFVSVSKTYNFTANGIVQDNGIVGYYRAIPVYLSDCGTKDNANLYCYLIKKKALGVVWQKTPTIEEHRNLSKIATDILASDLVAAKMVHTSGVSVVSVKKGA